MFCDHENFIAIFVRLCVKFYTFHSAKHTLTWISSFFSSSIRTAIGYNDSSDGLSLAAIVLFFFYFLSSGNLLLAFATKCKKIANKLRYKNFYEFYRALDIKYSFFVFYFLYVCICVWKRDWMRHNARTHNSKSNLVAFFRSSLLLWLLLLLLLLLAMNNTLTKTERSEQVFFFNERINDEMKSNKQLQSYNNEPKHWPTQLE